MDIDRILQGKLRRRDIEILNDMLKSYRPSENADRESAAQLVRRMKIMRLGILMVLVVANLRDECLKRNWDIDTLADKTAFPGDAISKIMNFDAPVTLTDVEHFANTLGLAPGELLQARPVDAFVNEYLKSGTHFPPPKQLVTSPPSDG